MESFLNRAVQARRNIGIRVQKLKYLDRIELSQFTLGGIEFRE